MRKCYFRERNYRTLREAIIATKKPPLNRRFLKMVPLNDCSSAFLRLVTASGRPRINSLGDLSSELTTPSLVMTRPQFLFLPPITINKKGHPKVLFFINGAADKNRTYDPVITNDVLYH